MSSPLETLPSNLLTRILRFVPPVADSETHLNTPDWLAHELANKGRNTHRDPGGRPPRLSPRAQSRRRGRTCPARRWRPAAWACASSSC
jgi:hypothetical protein